MIIASFWIYLLVLVCLVSLCNNICITQSWENDKHMQNKLHKFKKGFLFLFWLLYCCQTPLFLPDSYGWMISELISHLCVPPTSGTCVPHRGTPRSPKGSLSKLCSTWSRLYCSCWKLSSIFRSIATPPRILIQF